MFPDADSTDAGFSLVETLVAIAILLTVVTSLASLFALAAKASQRAAWRTQASLAALGKLEQLRSTPPSALIPSPAAALDDDLEGYSDQVRGDDGARPSFARRWSITPLVSTSAGLVRLQVVVLGPGGDIEARLATLAGERPE